jgi:hypothetical protein
MTETQPIVLKKRDGALNFWLILLLIANILFLLSQIPFILNYFFFPWGTMVLAMFSEISGVHSWGSFAPLFVVFSLVSICSIVALFMWKRWGFYALCLVVVASFLISMFVVRVLSFGIIVNGIAIGILGILLRLQWNLFR